MGADFSHLMIESITDYLPRFLLELVLVLFFVRVLGRLLSYVRQPYVIGEMVAGILLGPTAFGQIPHFTEFFFPAQSQIFLELIAEIALMFFMFFLGLEIQPEGILATWKNTVPTAIASIMFPFGFGICLAFWLFNIVNSLVPFPGFALFLGLCMSFTAFPVLARILAETKGGRVINSPLGDHVLAIAAVDDILAWTCMALIIAYATGASKMVGLYAALLTIAFIGFQILVIRPLLKYIHKKLLEKDNELDQDFIVFLLLLMLLSSWVTESIGIHAFFGSFCFGLMVPKEGKLSQSFLPQLELLILHILVPLYFAYSGLRTNLLLINTPQLFFTAILITFIATIGKMLPAVFLYKWFGHNWPFSASMGILLNTRGMVSLIAANIGLSAKVIDTQLFSMLIVMNLLTTCITPPIFYTLYEKYLVNDKTDPDLQERAESTEVGEVVDVHSPLGEDDFYTQPDTFPNTKTHRTPSHHLQRTRTDLEINTHQHLSSQTTIAGSSSTIYRGGIEEEGRKDNTELEDIPMTEMGALKQPLSPHKLRSDTPLKHRTPISVSKSNLAALSTLPPQSPNDKKVNQILETLSEREISRLKKIATAMEASFQQPTSGNPSGSIGHVSIGGNSQYHSRTIGSVNLKW